jgi:Xaa-Pro aminopeptidase
VKKVLIWIIIIAFVLSGLVAAVFSNELADVTNPAIKTAPPAPKFTDAERQAELARRRAAVAAKMAPNSTLILWAAQPRNYAGDVDFYYRQENNLYYLTNLKQGGSILVMTKGGNNVSEFLFLPKRNPQFETWNGRMYSNEDAARISGIDKIVDSSQQAAFFEALRAKKPFTSKENISIANGSDTLYLLLPNSPGDGDGMAEFRREKDFSEAAAAYKTVNARSIFDELRLIKSPYEIKVMQHAIDISAEAHMRSMAMAGRAEWEYQVHAEVEYTFRRRNADYWGYPSIVGCGPNATTLHYVESQSPIKKGEILLMDVGAEYDHYTADVTRSFPVNGKFTKEQADIYRIVYDAQEAAAAAAKPGASFSDVGRAANAVITDGLLKLGLITAKDPRQVRVWYMHGLGHWLGMNVHDVGSYGTPLAPGMIFTNEPGIYIREDALNYLPDTPENKEFIAKVRPAFERYKNIGIRIEDDMLVTPNGVEWMTKNLPRKLEDIEAFMAKASKELQWTASNTSEPTNVFIGASRMRNDPSSPSVRFASRRYRSGGTVRTGFRSVGETRAYSHSD